MLANRPQKKGDCQCAASTGNAHSPDHFFALVLLSNNSTFFLFMHLSPLAFPVESLAPGQIFQHDALDRDNALAADGGDVINDDAGVADGKFHSDRAADSYAWLPRDTRHIVTQSNVDC